MNAELLTDDALRYHNDHKGLTAMSLQEELVRIRIQEAQRFAEEQRLARRLSAVDRWRRVSRWAARRAARLDRGL